LPPVPEGISDHARDLGRRLLELQKVRRFNDDQIRELASLSGHVVELGESVEIDIDADDTARSPTDSTCSTSATSR
jgi:hypothetical protein